MAKPSVSEATEFCSPQAWLEDTGHYDLVLEEDRPEDTWFDVPVDRLPCPDGWQDLEEMHPEYVFVYEDIYGRGTVRPRTDSEAADMFDSLNRELDKFRLLRQRLLRKKSTRKFCESLREIQRELFEAEDRLRGWGSYQGKKGGA
jgi:hypothetical protein